MTKKMLKIRNLFAKFQDLLERDENFSKTIITISKTHYKWELLYNKEKFDLKANKAINILESIINSPSFVVELFGEIVIVQINKLILSPFSYNDFLRDFDEIEELLRVWISYYKYQ